LKKAGREKLKPLSFNEMPNRSLRTQARRRGEKEEGRLERRSREKKIFFMKYRVRMWKLPPLLAKRKRCAVFGDMVEEIKRLGDEKEHVKASYGIKGRKRKSVNAQKKVDLKKKKGYQNSMCSKSPPSRQWL